MTDTGEAAPKLGSGPDAAPPTAGIRRLDYLDNLRAVVVLAVLPMKAVLMLVVTSALSLAVSAGILRRAPDPAPDLPMPRAAWLEESEDAEPASKAVLAC